MSLGFIRSHEWCFTEPCTLTPNLESILLKNAFINDTLLSVMAPSNLMWVGSGCSGPSPRTHTYLIICLIQPNSHLLIYKVEY